MQILALAMNTAKQHGAEQGARRDPRHQGLQGHRGRIYNYDQNGDGLRGYNVVKNDDGKIVYDKHIEFDS